MSKFSIDEVYQNKDPDLLSAFGENSKEIHHEEVKKSSHLPSWIKELNTFKQKFV